MNYFYLALVTIPLAVWRISNMLSDTTQEGLFNSLDWIRGKLGVNYDPYSEPSAKPGSIAAGLLCHMCSSVWFGIVFAVLLLCNSKVTFFVTLPFAVSTLVIFLEDWRSRWISQK